MRTALGGPCHPREDANPPGRPQGFRILSAGAHVKKVDVPRAAALAKYLGRDVQVDLDRKEFDSRQLFVSAALSELSKKLDFTILDLGQSFCNTSKCVATRLNDCHRRTALSRLRTSSNGYFSCNNPAVDRRCFMPPPLFSRGL